jgi:hypothetical protein
MSEMDKYYQVLGLKPGASEKEIVEAYKVLIKVWDPNRFLNDPNMQKIANEKMKGIDEAYKQLLIWIDRGHEKGRGAPELEVRPKADTVVSTPQPRATHRMEVQEQIASESKKYGSPTPSLHKPPLEASEGGAIWNPEAAGVWSFFFTPAFGSYLQMLNWRTLGEPAKASSAQAWFYASLVMLFIWFLVGMFMSGPKAEPNWFWLHILYLIIWYFASGRSQEKYVKAKFGTNYSKKPWGQALLIAVGASIGCSVVAVLLRYVFMV